VIPPGSYLVRDAGNQITEQLILRNARRAWTPHTVAHAKVDLDLTLALAQVVGRMSYGFKYCSPSAHPYPLISEAIQDIFKSGDNLRAREEQAYLP
jgi:hypothetical protein